MDQGTAEWFAARLGKATASRICDIIATTKSGWGASRANYAAQLVAERLTGMAGASPDGLVGEDGLVEIKCPNTATHIATLVSQTVPAKYRTQMMWQLACTGRHWCDFASYDPRLPESMRLFVQRVERDDAEIARLEAHVIDFLGEVDETVSRLRALYETRQLEAA
jgi:predicted phage-related endonuclease